MNLVVEKISGLSPQRRQSILRRSMEDVSAIYDSTKAILDDIQARGDAVNVEHYLKLKADLTAKDFLVTPEEVQEAYKQVEPEVVEHLKIAAKNIRTFHSAQLDRPMWQMEVSPGILAGRKNTPLDSAGCYVPGRRAAYPSSVLMTILPAVVAGVSRVVVTTPPDDGLTANPYTLVACDIAGVAEVYKLGGPWAVGALAHGTDTIPKVAKIVGPGNKYVTAAKMLVYGLVDIDSPAGPSEALILADKTADPHLMALDFFSQIEHDPDAAAVIVTDDKSLAQAICQKINELYPDMPRKEILDQAVRYCAVLLAASMEEAIEFTNEYAAEHLEIITAEPFITLQSIRHAGSIFMGPWAPVPVGDYASGTNHVLPTGQAALSFSGLSVDDFIKKPTYQYLTADGLKSLGETITTLAEAEGLPIHAMTIRARLEKMK